MFSPRAFIVLIPSSSDSNIRSIHSLWKPYSGIMEGQRDLRVIISALEPLDRL